MLVACWSAKGGSGTTVVSAALALLLARSSPAGALVVDLAGDLPAALGVPEPDSPGIAGWLAAGGAAPPDALHRLEVPVGAGVRLLPAGPEAPAAGPDRTGARDLWAAAAGPDRAPDAPAVGADPSGAGDLLAAALGADPRPVVVDCGVGPSGPGLAVAAAASLSLLVTRPCFLALRRAAAAPLRPSAVVLVAEAGRSLCPDDVEAVVGAPVRAVVPVDAGVARAVDAGLLTGRVPRLLERSLRAVA